jgi:hypothetical protein
VPLDSEGLRRLERIRNGVHGLPPPAWLNPKASCCRVWVAGLLCFKRYV